MVFPLTLVTVLFLLTPQMSLGSRNVEGRGAEALGEQRRTFNTFYKELQDSYPRLMNPSFKMTSWPIVNFKRNKKNRRRPTGPCGRDCFSKGQFSMHKRPLPNIVYQSDFIPIRNPYQNTQTTPPSSNILNYKSSITPTHDPPTKSRAPPPTSSYRLKKFNKKNSSSTQGSIKPRAKLPPKEPLINVSDLKNIHGFNFKIDHTNGYSYVSQSLGSSNN